MMQEFPSDPATFSMDDQFMLGSAIVIKPVAQQGQTEVETYLPKSVV
jgi:alpha-glucosidase (family GH31 glycosyl hydrolase)